MTLLLSNLPVKIKFSFVFFLLVLTGSTSYSQTDPPVRMCVDIPIIYNENANASSGVFDINARWVNGSTIKVKFNGGSAYVQSKVKFYAVMWETYANVKFDFGATENPDILVGFKQDGTSWSYVGNNCRMMAAKGETSMNFGWFTDKSEEDEFKRTTLHEFGHALGLLHEHQNPAGHIQWNKPVVRNYYSNQGWSMDQIDKQIFNKYSVTLSNHNYDDKSIMHYPIPANFTLDNYAVNWNRDLSPGDITLIGELYPKPVTVKPTDPVAPAASSCTLQEINVQHNQYKNEIYGMQIFASFTIKNAIGKSCRAIAYFFNEDGTPLQDENDKYGTIDNKVAVAVNVNPQYAITEFKSIELFMPYDELHRQKGKSFLKFKISIWNDKNEMSQSGAYYFNYSKGIICESPDVVTLFENEENRMAVMPKFTIEYAKNVGCTATVYFYHMDGTPLNNEVGFAAPFTPAYQTTTYNYGYYSDLYIYVDYDSLALPPGDHELKYFVTLTRNGEQFATSQWQTFLYTQY